MRNLIFLLFIVVLGVSCVPNRKIVYLQKGNELKEEFPKDTVIRIYNLDNYEYRLQPEDIISVRFKSLTLDEFDIFSDQEIVGGGNFNSQILGGYLVDKDGNVGFPELGKVKVAGLTLHETQEKLQKMVEAYLEQPSVKVRLLNFRVTVLGEVNAEGTVNTFNNRMTIMEAIGQAGGLGELADRSNVKVIRQGNGMSEIIYVNLLDESLMNSTYFFAHQNDIIIVPPLKQRPFRRYFGQNLSIFVSSLSVLLLTITLITN
ncbi:polysaccharide export protein [Fulvivirga sp. 29W222]|uniref:Polysaccharide export protein n=1 Tax=Fulvivirga marina TaxID=2494733 RepID=A0A937FUW7_9BACT|nr:polysaccharide biosynthesis/export family protein [Fulvivirga marina]MBL6444750.1 polysaccharide export protein [Fulvivirga marina]